LKKFLIRIYSDISKDIKKIYQRNVIGIIFISIGIILLSFSFNNPIFINIGAMLISVGIILLSFSFNNPIFINIGAMSISVGIILLSFFLYNSIFINIGTSIILIGFFIVFLKTGEKTTNRFSDSLIISIIITWTIIAFFITTITNIRFDAIFILITIGLIVINEFISESLPILLRNRIHFSIFVFFLIFLVLLSNEILNIART
jgi:hypothetical protein